MQFLFLMTLHEVNTIVNTIDIFIKFTPFNKNIISQGYCGTELVEKFKEASRKVRPAVETLIAKADKVALNLDGADDEKFKEIFKREN